MNVNDAITDLTEAGADIKQIGENAYLVTDNGFWGFCEETDPFVVDGDDILEMWEQYIEEKFKCRSCDFTTNDESEILDGGDSCIKCSTSIHGDNDGQSGYFS